MEIVMKRKTRNILTAVICIFCLTGCIRLEEEKSLLSRGSGHTPSPYHFYMGSKYCIGFMIYYWPFAPVLLLDLPFEMVADTLCLPHDIYLYHDYKQNPPLDLLIKEKRYDELEKRLKAGEDPNKYDWRTISNMRPVEQALHDQDVKAYSLLLEHGAVPDKKTFTDHIRLTNENKEIIRLALERSPEKYDVIRLWCENYLRSTHELSVSEQQVLIDIIEMMANHGFPVQSSAASRYQRKTALDMAYDDKTALSPENRQKLIDILKAHSGKTYVEMTRADKSLPHLHTENLQIDPMFNQIIERLEKSWQSDQYRLSTHYDGIDGPVLVVDLPMPPLNGPRKPLESRMTAYIHRRLNATKWNQKGEPFDVPTGWRMIATPKGRKMPSRLSPDMPRLFLHEEWTTLPECEVYLERPGLLFVNNSISIHEILKLDKTTDLATKLPEHHDVWAESYFLSKGYWKTWTSRLTNIDEKWLSSLNEATASVGLPGQWNRCFMDMEGMDNVNPVYVYDMNGKFSQITPEHPEIIPTPDEIICLFFTARSSTDKLDRNRTVMNSRDGKSYWNYRWIYISGIQTYIFFGDEVSMDQLNQMQTVIENVIKNQ